MVCENDAKKVPSVFWREFRVGGVEFVIKIGEDVLKLNSKGIAEVEITNNRHDVVVVIVFF